MDEIGITLNEGWKAEDAKEGTIGKLFVFPYTCIVGEKAL